VTCGSSGPAPIQDLLSEMFLEGLQEELVIPGVGIAAVVDLVVGGVDFGRGKFLTVLKKGCRNYCTFKEIL
jgi:hypothetical protein